MVTFFFLLMKIQINFNRLQKKKFKAKRHVLNVRKLSNNSNKPHSRDRLNAHCHRQILLSRKVTTKQPSPDRGRTLKRSPCGQKATHDRAKQKKDIKRIKRDHLLKLAHEIRLVDGRGGPSRGKDMVLASRASGC